MEHFEIDAYSPREMAQRVETAGVSKANLDALSMFSLAILAGAFIAFGAIFYTFVTQNSTLPSGLSQLIGGLVFCLGLILVVVAGAELFTGNNLIVMAYVSKKVTTYQLFRNWLIVYLGNLVGALIMVGLIYYSGHWSSGEVGAKALAIANKKVNLSFNEALVRGILCNILVCLAVWLCFAGRSVTDKILAIVFPITAFVALGFEHSVANMYFVPAGNPDISQLTIHDFVINNLLPVTIGNIIGGSVMVGAVYWFIYLRVKS
jgi:formate/nitrite transporter